MQNVLVDTSGWIDFFRHSAGQSGDSIKALIENDCAYLTGVIKAELLHGVRGNKEVAQLNILFNAVPCLAVAEDDWIATGRLLRQLRGKGITVPLTDALIAVIARKHEMSVLTHDKHFEYLPVECVFGDVA